MRNLLLIIVLLVGESIFAQEYLRGRVFEYNVNGNKVLEGATIHWQKTNLASISSKDGSFVIKQKKNKNLITSFVGYKTDTSFISGNTDSIHIILVPGGLLNTVEVKANTKATQYNFSAAINEVKLNEKELHKAACCNLSESFETTSSIDVSIADAVTGTKQIKMLGLGGKYMLSAKDNIPHIRGFNSHMGMMFIPGTWINSIAISKGIGSVVNGHEDITGQINVALKQPDTSQKNDYNIYINNEGRIENNLILHEALSKKLSTNILIHQNSRIIANDRNDDNFLDLPIGAQYNFANLWKYIPNQEWILHAGWNLVKDRKIAGILPNSQGPNYPISMYTDKIDAYIKAGKIYKGHPLRSLGIQASQMYYAHLFQAGDNEFKTYQNASFLNIIFQDMIKNSNHQYKIGFNFTHDEYDQIRVKAYQSQTTETITGAFGEYQLKAMNKLTLICGLRLDYSSLWGLQTVPRLHLKYDVNERFKIRTSHGQGYRTAFALPENQYLLLTNRQRFLGYGQDSLIALEKSFTNGINVLYNYQIGLKEGTFSMDYYQTQIDNQLIVDQNTLFTQGQYVFYANQIGGSARTSGISNTFQIENSQAITDHITIRTAYKNTIVKQSMGEVLKVPRHRGFTNLYYQITPKWELDYTLQFIGPQWLANSTKSPWYSISNTQITRKLKNENALYLGVENLFNYRQENPISSAEDPSHSNFDLTQVWAPIFGRTIYLGLRYKF